MGNTLNISSTNVLTQCIHTVKRKNSYSKEQSPKPNPKVNSADEVNDGFLYDSDYDNDDDYSEQVIFYKPLT